MSSSRGHQKDHERAARDRQWSQWMAQAQSGDSKAYESLLREVLPFLKAIISHKLSGLPSEQEDLVQEAVIAIHKARHTYQPERNFTYWASAIVRYKLVDFYRRNGIRKTVSLEQINDFSVPPEDPFEVNKTEKIEKALDLLPDDQREAVRMTKLQGLSTTEAANKMGISSGALRVRIHRAYEKLRQILSEESS